MKKTLNLALMFTISLSTLAYAIEEHINDDTSSGSYVLDEEKIATQKLKSLDESIDTQELDTQDIATKEQDTTAPKVITEEIPNGRVEKLIDEAGKIIAEKTIENDKVVKKVLNYYYPSGQLMRQVTALEDDTAGYYSEEYYSNGKIASQATYINELNKIGKEKKYDTQGVLRQEISWKLPKSEENKPIEERQTVRQGNVVTYYPSGKKAAVFAVGNKGDTIFYNEQGDVLKTIKDSNILNFSAEINPENCQNQAIQLSLDDLIELYEDEGDISYNKCGLPYRENFVYEVFDTQGTLTQKVSYDETGMIRRIIPYISGKKSGTEKKYDGSGNLTAEVKYQRGLKNGTAIGYFPTREIAFKKEYVEGKVEGKLTCYFPTGEVAAELNYKNGLKEGTGKVNSPIERTLEFSHNQLLDNPQKQAERKLTSILPNIKNVEPQCLDIQSQLSTWLSVVKNKQDEINQAFAISLPQECEDISSFKQNDENQLECFDSNNVLRATISASYHHDEYVTEKIYDANGKLVYEIPYRNKQKQGWVKKYGANSEVVTEVFLNQGEMADSSHSYYPDGHVKDVLSIADNAPRKIYAQYQNDGSLNFSLTYKEDKKQEAFLSNSQEDVFIRYYENQPDSISLTTKAAPYDFAVYNLALNEYALYNGGEVVSGGKICDYMLANEVTETHPQPMEDIEISPEDADFIQNLEPITPEDIADIEAKAHKDYKIENAIIPTAEEKHQAELAARNIGPITKPDIEDLSAVVQKEKVETEAAPTLDSNESKTEKFYYPNGNLRKTVKTKGTRTEEVKEYSKSGLLLTDTVYQNDKIVIEKYFGSGEVRRKTEKTYSDNTVLAFLSREDYFDTGKPRYTIARKPDTLLFTEKTYYPDGQVKSEITQNSIFSSQTDEYTQLGGSKETTTAGLNVLVKEYDENHNLQKFTMNNKEMPLNLETNSADLLKDNSKLYTNGALVGAYKVENNHDDLIEYYKNGKVKTEIVFYHNGEISVKHYNTSGALAKFAYLAPDGKLHIEKPIIKTVPSYRERYWVDYNNPRWIENQDRYSIKSITQLNLDTAAYILTELGIDIPELLKQLYNKYE